MNFDLGLYLHDVFTKAQIKSVLFCLFAQKTAFPFDFLGLGVCSQCLYTDHRTKTNRGSREKCKKNLKK
jgi:hypothetical protein